jgi:hypothetical protein
VRPAVRITSGKRNWPPISTNWPRDRITSRPAATAATGKNVAAGVVVDDERVSAPVNVAHKRLYVRLARAASPGFRVHFQRGVARAPLGHGAAAAGASVAGPGWYAAARRSH